MASRKQPQKTRVPKTESDALPQPDVSTRVYSRGSGATPESRVFECVVNQRSSTKTALRKDTEGKREDGKITKIIISKPKK